MTHQLTASETIANQLLPTLTLEWLGRTATGSIVQTPESLAASNTANVPAADVYYFRPHEVTDGPLATWIVPASLVLESLSQIH